MWVLLLVGAAVGAYGWTCVRLLSMLRCRRRQRASRCAWPNPAGAHLDLTSPPQLREQQPAPARHGVPGPAQRRHVPALDPAVVR